MIWKLRRFAKRPGIALGASVVAGGLTLVVLGVSIGTPLGWRHALLFFAGGLTTGLCAEKAKRDWHDAWVQRMFNDVVLGAPREATDAGPLLVLEHEEVGDDDEGDTEEVLSLPHDGPDSDVILSLPHSTDRAAS